jgi:hypothetical protein
MQYNKNISFLSNRFGQWQTVLKIIKTPTLCSTNEINIFQPAIFVTPNNTDMERYNENASRQRESIRRDQLATVQDLLDFKDQIINDIKKLLKEQNGIPGHQWLKSIEIKKMLRLSDGKLQYLRDKGVIPFKKLGGVTYYNLDDIQQLMSSGKLDNQLKSA